MPQGDGKFNIGQSPQEYYGNEDHALRIRALEGVDNAEGPFAADLP